jgi:hypothetical protein
MPSAKSSQYINLRFEQVLFPRSLDGLRQFVIDLPADREHISACSGHAFGRIDASGFIGRVALIPICDSSGVCAWVVAVYIMSRNSRGRARNCGILFVFGLAEFCGHASMDCVELHATLIVNVEYQYRLVSILKLKSLANVLRNTLSQA